jgi:hypothetical protein
MKGPLSILLIFCILTVNSAYVPHSVELELRQVDVVNELATLIETHTTALDLLLPKYAFFPIESILGALRADIAALHAKDLTEDFTSYAPVDGFYITSRNAMTDWYIDMLELYRLKYQSHIYGPYTFKIVQLNPQVIEINTTQTVSGFSENPAFIPVSFGQQDKLVSSILSTHLIYQYTRVGGKWLMNYKNEDFSKLHRFCQHTCDFLAPHCVNTTGSCTSVLANFNGLLNPHYPPPVGYVGINNPVIIYS